MTTAQLFGDNLMLDDGEKIIFVPVVATLDFEYEPCPVCKRDTYQKIVRPGVLRCEKCNRINRHGISPNV